MQCLMMILQPIICKRTFQYSFYVIDYAVFFEQRFDVQGQKLIVSHRKNDGIVLFVVYFLEDNDAILLFDVLNN